jgi:hypothetical protein
MFSSETAHFGRPLRPLPSMHISLRLNLANHFSTVISLVQSPNNVYQAKPWLQQYFFSPKSNASLTHDFFFLSIFSQYLFIR